MKGISTEPCQLVLADAPGQLTEQLNIVAEPADNMVILVSDKKSCKLEEWRERAHELDISVNCEITSFLDDDAEVHLPKGEGGKIVGSIKSTSRDDFDVQGTHAYDDRSSNVIRYVATTLLKRARKDRTN